MFAITVCGEDLRLKVCDQGRELAARGPFWPVVDPGSTETSGSNLGLHGRGQGSAFAPQHE